MRYTDRELAEKLTFAQFPRSAAYDPQWMLDNQMGPNVLWLSESLSQVMDLRPSMRVLDMGCGRALSSIFLAKEFGVQVWATDLWIGASENWGRVCAAGMQERVFPVHAEAHALPFADEFFDAIVSLDAYHYFGSDDLYLGYFIRFLRSGGELGIVVPGLQREFAGDPPDYIQPYWDWDFWSLHSPTWWHRHWEKTGKVDVVLADCIPEGWQYWLRWQEVQEHNNEAAKREADMLRADKGRNLSFTRLVARRK